MESGPPGSSVHGILQARMLEWLAIPFFRDLPNLGTKPGSPTESAGRICRQILYHLSHQGIH